MSLADAWIAKIPETVRAQWADALPDALLQLWWAEHDRARVYAVCGWTGPSGPREGMAPWFAALDPEPSSKEVTDVVRAALEGRTYRVHAYAVLATAPLIADRAVSRARAFVHLDRCGTELLWLRLDAPLDAVSDFVPTTNDREVRALQFATKALRLGPGAAAREALVQAWMDAEFDPDLRRALLLPTRALGAWDLVPSTAHEQHPWVAFLAALDGEATARAALGPSPEEERLARAALALRPLPPDWRARLDAIPPEEIASRFHEGLYTEDDRCCLTLARALGDPRSARAVDAAVIAEVLEAQQSAVTFADWVAARRAGTGPEIHAKLGRRILDRTMTKLRTGQGGDAVTGLQLIGALERLASSGAAGEVPARLAEIRAVVSSAPWLDTLRAFEAGGALPALREAEAEGRLASPHLVQALIRDGHRTEAAQLAQALLDGPARANVLELLAPAIDVLEPQHSARLAPAIAEALAELPGASADAANAWLLGAADD